MSERRDFSRVEDLYHAARARAQADRDAFLEDACGGDEDLLREVKSLLDYEGEANRLLEEPAVNAATQAAVAAPAPSWVGRRLASYDVLAPLGAGAMGAVYRAKDSKLGREVALKVLPEAFSRDPERVSRFRREARLLAALNHPSIASIHGLEESEGRHFLVLELVPGETLAERTARGPMPLAEALPICRQVAEALEAAHELGIIHRDLKPANIAVTREGQVKLLDFGLAKVSLGRASADDPNLSPPESAAGTREGVILGTASYMSPEQARGKPLDERTDIWSFGCVLYEALTGRRAYGGETVSDILAAVLERDVDWDALPGTTPASLRRLLRRCLDKDGNRRLHDIADARIELEDALGEPPEASRAPSLVTRADGKRRVWLVGGAVVAALAVAVFYLQARSPPEPPPAETASPERTMLVVLPFENLGAPEDTYFAAGMTDEITSRLARVSGLGVISRTSAVQYDRTGKTTKQIGEELGVGFVLGGTVRWARAEGAGRVLITPRLIRVADDTHIWADSYDRVLDDIFAAQSEIAEAVVEQLGVALLPQEQAALEARPTESLDAYQAYLKGLEHEWDPDFTKASKELAVQMFERAVELDPDFVEAHAALAGAHMSMRIYDRTPERLARAREAVDRALALDPESPDAHLALGSYRQIADGDRERALEEYAFVARRRPNDSRAALLIAGARAGQGRFDEAIAQLERALALDPRNATVAGYLGHMHRFLARYSEAHRYFDLAISLAPDKYVFYQTKASSYMEQGLLERARATAERMPDVDQYSYFQLWVDLERRERDYQGALNRLGAFRTEVNLAEFGLGWKEVSEGLLYRLIKQPERARASYEAAVAILEDAVSEPRDIFARVRLAQAYAGLGRKAEAIRESGRVMELSPLSRYGQWVGSTMVVFLAEAYTTAGEHDAALDLLESLASIPSWMSYGYLRFEPALDPLRDNPRFQKLLADKKKQLSPR